jgi:iron complex transport system substrate-binding protein
MLAIAACQGETDRSTINPALTSSSPTDCQTVRHEIGETKICGQPHRIVVLGTHLLESLLVLGVQPVGFADYTAFRQRNYDNPSQQIPYLGDRITPPLANVGTAYSPSFEAIVKVQPDLILSHSANVSQYETLSKIAPTLLLNPNNAEKNLRAIAQIFDRSEQANRLLAETEQRMAIARRTFAPLVATHAKVLLLVASQPQEMLLGNSTSTVLCSSALEELGFQQVFPPGFDRSKPDWAVPISLETLPQLEADSVILLGHNSGEPDSMDSFENHQLAKLKQGWEKNAIAQSLKASKVGRVYFIPFYMCASLPGPIGTELYLEELEKQLLPPS